MTAFSRITLSARNRQFARGWLSDAKARYIAGKADKLSGILLDLHVIRVHVGDDTNPQGDSYRSAVAYSLLTSGPGVYNIDDIAHATDLSAGEVRSAVAYLVQRTAAAQPFFPWTLVYNKADKQVRVSRCEGAREEIARLVAPRAKKAPVAALPVPDSAA